MPILIVLGLFVATVVVENKVDAVDAQPGHHDRRLRLPVGLGVPVPQRRQGGRPDHRRPDMVVPTGPDVRIYLRSYDVLHGFYVPEFNFSRYASPGYWTSSTSTSLHDGVYRGQCTQLCGLYHSLMFFNVRSVSPAAYADVAARRPAPSSGRTPSSIGQLPAPACQPQRDRAQLLWQFGQLRPGNTGNTGGALYGD